MAFASAVDRDNDRKARLRLDELTRKFTELARAGAEIEGDPEWNEWRHMVSSQEVMKMREEAARSRVRAERDALIAECTSPMQPNQVHREVEEQLRRTNLLLAAILKHLTRDL